VHVLINEILCISTWRQEILPKLTEEANKDLMDKSYLLYIILYHESVVISLLEVLLFHGEMCAALEDLAIELVDYCAAEITHLISQ
jgi:zinc finger MYND domain-containing protein 10